MLEANSLRYIQRTTGQQGVAQVLTPTATFLFAATSIFILSALIGVWTAYNLGSALQRLGLIVLGLGMMFGIAWASRRQAKIVLSWTGVGCAFWAAGLSLAYLLKLTPNSGAVASGLIVLLPLAAIGVGGNWIRRQWTLVWLAGAAMGLAIFTLTISHERTAWAGLVGGFICAGIVAWRFSAYCLSSPALQRATDLVLSTGILIGLTSYTVLLLTPTFDGFIRQFPGGAALLQRETLWRESVALLQDYYFTGSGLGVTAMVYSTYVVLLHVPYWDHAHNLFLQVGLEQGMPGLVAFTGMEIGLLIALVMTYRECGSYSRWFYLTTITSMTATLIYGFLDSELYATSTVSILFLPLGFALALHWEQARKQQKWHRALMNWTQQKGRLFTLGLLPVAAVGVLCLMPNSFAKFYVNLGVVAQTKAELSQYQWPLWPIQDELRRQDAVNLEAAIAAYQAGLALDPGNITAHQRLGQLALSQGDYQTALQYLRLAYAIAPERNVVRLLLGETYAVTGNVEQAAALWQTVTPHEDYFAGRIWWYSNMGIEQRVDWLKQAVAKIQ